VQPINILDQAAAQATAILQQAKATALVLEAHAQATAVMEQAQVARHTPTPASTPVAQAEPVDRTTVSPTPKPTQERASAPTAQSVEVLRVGFGADGAMIHIQFRAPPDIVAKWWQGSVSVIDEATGTVYNEIPVMPRIGPLIGRPARAGQLGYVMLVNAPPYLRPGAEVTVVLGKYTFEHLPVE
jgi:hypothetical protein